MKSHLYARFVETEDPAKSPDILFFLLLPSQSEVLRGEIEKHQLMHERGNIPLPLPLPHPQNPGRRVGRKGKMFVACLEVSNRNFEWLSSFYIHVRLFAKKITLLTLFEVSSFDSLSI